MEIWKDIGGYEGLYQISNFGRVKSLSRAITKNSKLSLKKERILKFCNDGKGYHRVWLYNNGNKKQVKVARLVAITFIPNPSFKKEVNHINGIKTDNNINNLEWVTPSENIKHAFDTGLKQRMPVKREKHGSTKLNTNQVIEIRKLLKQGLQQKEVGKLFSISQSVISQIKRKTLWKHV